MRSFRGSLRLAPWVSACIAVLVTGCFRATGSSVTGNSSLAALSGGNGLPYTGGIYRGPEKGVFNLGLVELAPPGAMLTAKGISTDHAGNMYVVGQYLLSPVLAGFVAKFGPVGQPLWITPLTRDGEVDGVLTDLLGNLYVAGQSLSGSIPGAQVQGSGIFSGFVSRLDPETGATIWTSEVHSAANIGAWGVAEDSAGNLYATGRIEGIALPGARVVGTPGLDSLWVMKLGSRGTIIWTTELGAGPGPGATGYGTSAYGNSVAVSPSGTISVTGWTSGQIQGTGATFLQLGSHGTFDLFVSTLAPDGSLLWTTQMGATGQTEMGTGLVIDPSGDLIISGTDYVSQGVADILISRLHSDGTLNWSRQLGLPGEFFAATSVIESAAGNFYAGAVGNGVLPGSGIYGNHGNYDDIVVSVGSSGATRWITQIGQSQASTLGGILTPAPTGGVYCLGTTDGNLADPTQGVRSSADMVIFQLNDLGNM